MVSLCSLMRLSEDFPRDFDFFVFIRLAAFAVYYDYDDVPIFSLSLLFNRFLLLDLLLANKLGKVSTTRDDNYDFAGIA